MRERKYDKNLPIQGNYYPITAATYIESRSVPEMSGDDGSSFVSRFTILSHQAHGVTSLNEGELGTHNSSHTAYHHNYHHITMY
jgi:hypothetical protein